MLDDVWEHDNENRLNIFHFVTSIKYDDRDLGTVLLAHAAYAEHKKTNYDFLLGRKNRHQVDVGRPDWNRELLAIKKEATELGHSDGGIFLCGPDRMAEDVYQQSAEISSAAGSNFHFYFHKETF